VSDPPAGGMTKEQMIGTKIYFELNLKNHQNLDNGFVRSKSPRQLAGEI
jgi:hypothetical protein